MCFDLIICQVLVSFTVHINYVHLFNKSGKTLVHKKMLLKQRKHEQGKAEKEQQEKWLTWGFQGQIWAKHLHFRWLTFGRKCKSMESSKNMKCTYTVDYDMIKIVVLICFNWRSFAGQQMAKVLSLNFLPFRSSCAPLWPLTVIPAKVRTPTGLLMAKTQEHPSLDAQTIH